MLGQFLLDLAQVVLVALFIGSLIFSMATSDNSDDAEDDTDRK
jgi:hypothetical protein